MAKAAEKKRALVYYPTEILSPPSALADLKAVADAKVQEKTRAVHRFTVEELKDFKPHAIGGLFGKVTERYAITAELMDSCENLGFIQIFGMGYDSIDVEAANERGILVSNLGEVGISSQSVAELAWAHILALARRIPQTNEAIKSGRQIASDEAWRADNAFYRGGPVLWGKTLGIIGLGKIGKRSAMIGKFGFNMRVIAYDPYVEATHMEAQNVEKVDLDTLLKESDVISIHAFLTDETRHMIDANAIAKMKKSVILVNDARGAIFDMPAVAKALEEERIYGVGIDTWPREPPDPNEPWVQSVLKSRRTCLTPHIGSQDEAMVWRHKYGLDNITRFCKGERPGSVVNPAAF